MTRGYQPDWDIDLRYGEAGETTVRDVLGLDSHQLEVKRKRYRDDQFYIETAQAPNGSDYKPSGIRTTRATYWAYVIESTGVIVLVPTERLRQTTGRLVSEYDGDNPTHGALVTLREILGSA